MAFVRDPVDPGHGGLQRADLLGRGIARIPRQRVRPVHDRDVRFHPDFSDHRGAVPKRKMDMENDRGALALPGRHRLPVRCINKDLNICIKKLLIQIGIGRMGYMMQ